MSIVSFGDLPDFTILERPKSSGLVKVRHFGITFRGQVWDVAPGREFGPVSFGSFLDGRQTVDIARLPQPTDPPGAQERLLALRGHVWTTWANCQHIAMEVATGRRSSPTRQFAYGMVALAVVVALLSGVGGSGNLPSRDSRGRFMKR